MGIPYRHKITIDKAKEFQDPERRIKTPQIIDAEFKNSDMALIPHPFQGNDLTGKSIVLIDPNSDIALMAEEIKEAGEDASEELFYKKYVTFGNEHLAGRVTPDASIMVVKPTWKNTK